MGGQTFSAKAAAILGGVGDVIVGSGLRRQDVAQVRVGVAPPQTNRNQGVLIMRKLIALVFN
jgi:hypothetical protein